VLILCYHAVSEDWDATLSITPQAFERQIELLAKKGYRGVTFAEAVEHRDRDRVMAVTFDDGYQSVGEIARPILDRFGIPATVFVPTRFVGRDQAMAWPGIDYWIGTPHEHELCPMSWQTLRSLAEVGWEIGSHSVSHASLPTLPDRELGQELVVSREECAHMTETDCRSLAVPYGDCDPRVVAAAREAGYSAVATIPWRLGSPDRFVWPRVGIYPSDGERAFRIKVSRLARRVRSSPASTPLAPLIHAVRGRRGKEVRLPTASAVSPAPRPVGEMSRPLPRAADRPRDGRRRIPGPDHEPHDRAEARRRGGADDVEPRHRRLEPARQARDAIPELEPAQKLGGEEVVSPQVDAVPGTDDDVVEP
jgi:peptidoglycan/xylan/chitin deacetylase (PgdA/CDA1 family)